MQGRRFCVGKGVEKAFPFPRNIDEIRNFGERPDRPPPCLRHAPALQKMFALRRHKGSSLLASFDPDYPEAAAPPGRKVGKTGLAGRRFLIVSAPFGPFGRVFSDVLRARGAEVSRMLFNAGDSLSWRRPGGVPFRSDAGKWPERLLQLAEDYTDILVFGEGGAYNQAVLRNVERLNARVWVLENGYFRPDWITVEENGVNASSGLPRDRMAYDPPIPEMLPTRRASSGRPRRVAPFPVSRWRVAVF